MPEEPCPKCVVATAMGFMLNICGESLSDKIDCEKLSGKYSRGEISSNQVVRKIKRAARNNPEVLEELNDYDRMRKSGKIEP